MLWLIRINCYVLQSIILLLGPTALAEPGGVFLSHYPVDNPDMVTLGSNHKPQGVGT